MTERVLARAVRGQVGRKPAKKKNPETEIQTVLRRWLTLHGWRVFRHGSPKVRNVFRNGKMQPIFVKGDPEDNGLGDLLAFRYPYMLVVEVKTETGKLEASQLAVIADPRVGPFYVTAHSIDSLTQEIIRRGIPLLEKRPES